MLQKSWNQFEVLVLEGYEMIKDVESAEVSTK